MINIQVCIVWAANNFALRISGDIIQTHRQFAFIEGAKSPESLEYWKEKEKLYGEEEVKTLIYKLFAITGEGLDYTNLDKWFDQNKKK